MHQASKCLSHAHNVVYGVAYGERGVDCDYYYYYYYY